MEKTDQSDADNLLWNISVNDDKTAYRMLFETYYAPLCLYAKRFIEDRHAREDIVQDVFYIVWEKRKSIQLHTSAKGYLVTSVKNACLNQLRKQDYSMEFQNKIAAAKSLFTETSDDLYTLHELEKLLSDALAKLPPEYRIAFEMSRLEDQSTTEIARVMGISVRTVERYRKQATELLKKELSDYLLLVLILFFSK